MMGYPPLLGMVVPNLLERLIKIAGPITNVAIVVLGSIAGVCALLRKQFAVDQETCERETLAYVNELMMEELVHVVGA